jgi:chorismate mutase/prephenate dehydratase
MIAFMEDTKKLTDLRQQIDDIDFELLKLLNKRARTALRARIAKGSTTVYRPERETQVLEQVVAKNTGPLSDEAIKTLFQSIIYICRSIQEVKIKKGS